MSNSPKSFFGRLTTTFCILVVALPMALSAFFIKTFAVNIAFWDEYETGYMIEKLFSGNLGWDFLFSFHNEHRILFPRIISLSLGLLTHWDSRAPMWLGWLFLVLTSLLFFRVFRRSFQPDEADLNILLLKFSPIAWLMHIWRQHENLLWGYQFAFFLMMFAVLASLVLLNADRKIGWKFFAAIAAGIVATFSLANGLLIWPVGLLALIAQRFLPDDQASKSGWWPRAGIWTIAGLFFGISYIRGYSPHAQSPGTSFLLENPAITIRSALAFFGFLVSSRVDFAILAGALIVALFAAAVFLNLRAVFSRVRPVHSEVGQVQNLSHQIKKSRTPANIYKRPTAAAIIPCLLILFSLMSGALVVIGRAGGGMAAMSAPRYSTLSIFGLVGLYWLLFSKPAESGNRILEIVGLAVVVLIVTTNFQSSWKEGQRIRSERQSMTFYALTAPIQSEENMLKLYPSKQVIEFLEFARRQDYNVFRQAANLATAREVAANGFFYNLDLIDGQPLAPTKKLLKIAPGENKTLKLIGWAIDPQSKTRAWGMLLTLDGKLDLPVNYGLRRDDLAAFFANDDCQYSGFSADLPAEKLTPGVHSIKLKIFRFGGQELYQPELTIEVEPNQQ